MEHVGIHGLEEDGVCEDGLEQGGVEAGEVIMAVINSVLSLVIVTVLQRRAGELRVAESESIASCRRQGKITIIKSLHTFPISMPTTKKSAGGQYKQSLLWVFFLLLFGWSNNDAF